MSSPGGGDYPQVHVAQIKTGEPVHAWDDRDETWISLGIGDVAKPPWTLSSSRRHDQPPSFYDEEALQEKLHELNAEKSRLLSTEESLHKRSSRAEKILLDMRSRKHGLSTAASVLDGGIITQQQGWKRSGRNAMISGRDRGRDTRASHLKQVANVSMCLLYGDRRRLL